MSYSDDDEPMGHWELMRFRMSLRWGALRHFVRYRVLRRPRPAPPRRMNFDAFNAMLKEHYQPADLVKVANAPHPAFAALKRKEPS